LWLNATYSHFQLDLGAFVSTRPNFNYFGNSHNYDPTLEIFIVLVGWIFGLFSSINRLICPIDRNSHQISCILKVLYGDIEVYFYICIKIIFIIWKFIIQFFNCYYNCSKKLFEFENWHLNLKIVISIL